MTPSLSRRDLLKSVAAGAALVSLPSGEAEAGRPILDGCVRGKMTGAAAIVDTLLVLGVDCVFGVPGAQNNELWDTMKTRGLGYLLVTNEFSASIMADGYARATGKVGVISVVPGPGLTNALTGIGEALLDSVPMLCLVTDVNRDPKASAFQVHDLPNAALLEQVTKKVFCIRDVSEIPDVIRQAHSLALSGEPGPVGVVIPFPLLIQTHHYDSGPCCPPSNPWDEDAYNAAVGLLANPKKRIGIYAGIGCMDHSAALTQVAEMLQAPVATSVSGKGAIDETHPLAVGWGYGPQGTRTADWAFRHVDLVLAVGVRFSEVSTGFYSLPHKPLIHVDANPANLGRNYKADVCVAADAGLFLSRLLAQCDLLRRPPDGRLVGRIAGLKREDQHRYCPMKTKCGVDPMQLILTLRRCASPDALLYVDVTQAEHWAAEAYTVLQPRTYFNPTNNQAMGWSIAAALGGQRAFPGRQTIALLGDGCFLMSAMEISTAARACLPVKFFVLDDHAYHYMQTLQKSAYLRTTATMLARLDYAGLARGFGVAYTEVGCNDDLDTAVRSVLGYREPVLVRVVTDYGKREVRWIEAVKDRYLDELTTRQQIRFLSRIGSRAVHFTARDPLQND